MLRIWTVCSQAFPAPRISSAIAILDINTMRPVFSLIVWSLTAYAVYLLTTLLVTQYKRAIAAKARGCLPAPTFPSPDPAGITNVVRLIQANNAGRLLSHINERFATTTKQEAREVFTFQAHIMRNWLFVTCDPKNIQALLATQFKDFELGPIRFGTFAPLYVCPRATVLGLRR
jgi:hypothetical protein